MPTSSLFLRSGSMAKFAVLSLMASGAAAQYTLSADYNSGGNFFDNFDFAVGSPSDGYITYQSQVDATNRGLIYTAAGVNYIAVDPYAPDQAPKGIKITSKDEYTHGLFVANILNMPGGYCGVEGIFSTKGTGEIDIITGEGEATLGTYDVETPGTCSSATSFTDSNPYSFGDPFNQNGGGIYATSWDSTSIKIWFWSADETAPSDIFSASPDPTTWGPPVADFEGCSDDTNFKNNRIVFDTNFCNAAANAAFAADSTCSSAATTCQQFITQFPSAYDQSYWAIQSLMVYEYTGDSAASVETAAASSSTSVAAASSTSVSLPTGTPAIVPVVGPYTYIGCVNDIDTRLLTADNTASDDMTIEDCAAYCSGYQYFGLEYTRECYCGDSFASPDGTDTVNPDSACSDTCMGNPTEFCGGSMLLSLYELTADLSGASSSAAASSTVVPAAASSTVIPAAASSTVVPAAASSTIVPAAASSTVAPADPDSAASSTVVPTAASSTVVPDAAASSTSVAAASSTVAAASSSTPDPAASSTTAASSSAASPYAAASGSALPTAAMTSVVAPYGTGNSSVPTMTTGGSYPSLVLSTVYATTVYTITSCAATVTDCPARIGSVTTDIISLYTTWCSGNPTITPTPTPYSQKAVEAYTTVIVTQYVDYCPGNGQLTTITYSQTQVLSASPTYEATIPMYTTTKTYTNAGGETVCATLTIPSGAPVPTPETPSYPVQTGSPAPVVTAGTTTFTVVPVQSTPVYPAAPVYPAGGSNATANAGAYGAASGTTAASYSKSTYMASSGAGAKEFSFGAAVLALGATFAVL